MELWVSIKNFPNYEVSSHGRVRNIKTGRILKPGVNKHGYEIVALSNSFERKTSAVHRLVADNFYDGDHENLVVDHVDTNKRNNFIANLEFCTSGENNRRAYATGLKTPVPAYNQPTNRKVKIVETGEVFNSINECARYINGNHRHISDCLNGKLKTHKNFHYKEVE